MKPLPFDAEIDIEVQPPSGGCVLKLADRMCLILKSKNQPPSGGCVLKLHLDFRIIGAIIPAAFRRLCVETYYNFHRMHNDLPAAFRRLCVETR